MTDITNDPNPDNQEVDVGASILLDTTPKPGAPKPADAAKVEAPVDGEVIEYESTGDTGLDMALEFVGKAGLRGDHPAMLAAAEGDFSILRATLAARNLQGWEQFVKLGEDAYARTKEKESKASAALSSMVHAEAGGKDQWQAVQAWASQNATPEEKAQVNGLLNQGGVAAKGAVKYLLDAYNRANNVVVEPKDAAANASRGGNAGGADTGPLSAKDYAVAVQQLNVKLNGRLEGSKEYEALQRRRQMAR